MPRWAREAALKLTGFATSVIACKCEAAIERELAPSETPDGRPGLSVLLFAMDTDGLGKRLVERIGQTVLTCPTDELLRRAAWCRPAPNDRPSAARVRRRVSGEQGRWRRALLARSRDGRRVSAPGELRRREGHRRRKLPHPRRDAASTLAAAEASVAAIANMPGVILPFPGGVARSGSKVGSRRYKSLVASTNDAYCPTLRPLTDSSLPDDVQLGARDRARWSRRGVDPSRDAGWHRGRVSSRYSRDHRWELWRKAGPASLSSARDHGRARMRWRQHEASR